MLPAHALTLKHNQNTMKKSKFIQTLQKQRHQKRIMCFHHVLLFSVLVCLFILNDVGCDDKSVLQKYRGQSKEESRIRRNKEDTFEHSQEDYDPWRDSDRPKLFVDYLNGPLKGKTIIFQHFIIKIIINYFI